MDGFAELSEVANSIFDHSFCAKKSKFVLNSEHENGVH